MKLWPVKSEVQLKLKLKQLRIKVHESGESPVGLVIITRTTNFSTLFINLYSKLVCRTSTNWLNTLQIIQSNWARFQIKTFLFYFDWMNWKRIYQTSFMLNVIHALLNFQQLLFSAWKTFFCSKLGNSRKERFE